VNQEEEQISMILDLAIRFFGHPLNKRLEITTKLSELSSGQPVRERSFDTRDLRPMTR